MDETTIPEGLVRRTIIKDDGRFLNFYNSPGEEQPIDEADQPPSAQATAAGSETKHV